MCTEIDLGNKSIETIAELIELVGKDNITFLGLYTQPVEDLLRPDLCLCPVDMEATAVKSGYVSRAYNPDIDGDNWFMGYKWSKAEVLK
jgi:hypothetical protein